MTWIIFGSGVSGQSLARYFNKTKNKAFLYDDKPLTKEKKDFFQSCGIKSLNLRECKKKLKEGNSYLITSPGIKKSHHLLTFAKKTKASCVSEIDFALKEIKTPILAITGTNGKSTVASMCYHILKKTGHNVALVGNIGTPLSDLLIKKRTLDFLVLEISSYQLEQLSHNNFLRCVFMNFSKDHLERHGTLKNYFLAKWKIFNSKNKKALGFCGESALTFAQTITVKNKKTVPIKPCTSRYFKDFVPKNLFFPKHNKENASLSLKICRSVSSKPTKELAQTLKDFKTIKHRYELIATRKKTSFIEDSKATNLDATLSALSSTPGKILLFLGGLSKTPDFSPILRHKKKITKVICFGKASAKIKASLAHEIKLESFKNLKEALKGFEASFSFLSGTDYVLFSPACASQDEFKNFSERGLFFQKKIASFLKKEKQKSEGQKKR